MAGQGLNIDRYYVGQGEALLFERNATGARINGRKIGNAPNIQISGQTNEVKHTESVTGKKLVDDKIIWQPSVKIDLTIDNFSKANLAWVFGGKFQSINSGTVTGETVKAGPVMQLANIGVSNLVLKKGLTTVPAPNYRLTTSGMIEALVSPLNTGVADGDDLTADYSFAAYEEIGAFNASSKPFWFSTHAINLSPSVNGTGQSDVVLDCFKVIFMPNFQFDLIGENYGTLKIQGELIQDTLQSASSIGGQLFRERQTVQS